MLLIIAGKKIKPPPSLLPIIDDFSSSSFHKVKTKHNKKQKGMTVMVIVFRWLVNGNQADNDKGVASFLLCIADYI